MTTPGFVHQSVSIAADRPARREREAAAARVYVPQPIVLVPTPAMLAAGQRIVDARADQIPRTCAALVAKVATTGRAYRVTYAHALMPPKRGQQDWADSHSVCLRLPGFGFGGWVNGQWDGGVVRPPGGLLRAVGSAEFAALALGQDYAAPAAVVVQTAPCPACSKLVRTKKDGSLWAHACGAVAVIGTSLDSHKGGKVRYLA